MVAKYLKTTEARPKRGNWTKEEVASAKKSARAKFQGISDERMGTIMNKKFPNYVFVGKDSALDFIVNEMLSNKLNVNKIF